MHNEASRWISLDHVRVRLVVSTDRKASHWCVRRLLRPDRSSILFNVARGTEAAVRQNGKHRYGSSKIIRHQHESFGRMDAHMRRAGASGADGIEQRQLPIRSIDGEGANRTRIALTH